MTTPSLGRVLFGALAVFACTAPTVAAWAGIDDIRKSDNSVGVSLGGTYLDYRELDSGTGLTLDSERGWLANLGGEANLLAAPNAVGLLRNLYLHVDGGAAFGQTTYNGAYWNGTPASGTTDDTVWNGAVRVGRGFELGSSAMVIPFTELGYRWWDRNGQGAGGYDETYHSWDVMAGLLAQYSPAAKWVLSANAALGNTFGAGIVVGSPFSTSTSLGDALTWRAGGRVGYTFSRRMEMFTEADVTRLGYGASPWINSGQGVVMEPTSQTYETAIKVGVAYHFF